MFQRITPFAALLLIVALSGCSTLGVGKRVPQLMENEKFKNTSESRRIEDRYMCLNLADQVVIVSNPYGEVAHNAVVGAVVGAATGAISGAILENMNENIAAGAAVGTVVGIAQALVDQSEPSGSYVRFVENCLQDKGYKIIGWQQME